MYIGIMSVKGSPGCSCPSAMVGGGVRCRWAAVKRHKSKGKSYGESRGAHIAAVEKVSGLGEASMRSKSKMTSGGAELEEDLVRSMRWLRARSRGWR